MDTWSRIIASGNGYIYNDFGTQFPGKSPSWNTKANNKLHKVNCPHIKRMKIDCEKGNNKYFFAFRENAIDWLNANRKNEGYTFCLTCNP